MEQLNNNGQILEIKDLKVVYKTDLEVVEAVNGISFKIDKGKTCGLVGETGAGKTTTALSILGLLPERTGKVLDGEIIFEGRNILELPDEEPLEDDQDLPEADLPEDTDGEAEESDEADLEADDPRVQEAARIVRTENKASLSLLQRRMNIDRAQSYRIMTALEKLQIVGPISENGIREVLPYDEPDDGQSLDVDAETEG